MFRKVEFELQFPHFFFTIKQRLLFEELEKNKRTIIYCLLRKKYIAKNEHVLFESFFVMNKKLNQTTSWKKTKTHYVFKEILDKKGITIFQVRLEFLKYEIRNFSMQFAKLVDQSPKEDTFLLENKLEKLETATTYIENLE